MVHKFYAVRDDASIKKGMIISTIFAVIIAGGSYFMGGFGRLYYSADKIVYDEIVPTMVSSTMSDLLVGVVLLVVLSASISTLAALAITGSSTIISDFLRSVYSKLKPQREIVLIRIFCAVFIAVSVFIAMRPSALITSLMSLSWGALAGSFLGPFIYGLFWRRVTVAAVWTNIVLALAFVVANFVFGWVTPVVGGAIAMLSSLVLVPVVSLVTPKLKQSVVDYCFACYAKETITVPEQSGKTLKESAAGRG
jgi:SSS family solute:Na+ symporter